MACLAIWHLESKTVLFWVIVFLPKFAVAGPSHLVWFKNLTSTILTPSQGTIPKFRWPARSELIQNHKEGDMVMSGLIPVNENTSTLPPGGRYIDEAETPSLSPPQKLTFGSYVDAGGRLGSVSRSSDGRTAGIFEGIVGSSKPMSQVLKQVEKVAPSDSTVLILGETGTGKELIARALHRKSKRATRAFVRVNCAAIPESLVASELFGHEKGAFTGALQRRVGRFEAADGGTLFLDEVGELPMDTQIALLRVLQEREFERVGSNHPISIDVRVIAATNRDLSAAVAAGTFRRDLFYRLNVFPIAIPPLRERAEDIPLLLEYFVARYAKSSGKKIRNIGKDTLRMMREYGWPGNIRELQNVVERAVILTETDTFFVDENWLNAAPTEPERPQEGLLMLADREVEMIESALAKCHGRISGPSGAAAKLGIPRQTLESKIRRLGIDRYGQKRPAAR